MPYITQEARDELWEDPHGRGRCPTNAGELNYLFTSLVIEYFNQHRNYQGVNDIIGALEGAKLEFYRRQVAQYEDKKIIENGDVYTC